MLFHQELKHFDAGSIRDPVVLDLVHVNDGAESVEQAIKRVFFVRTNFIDKRVQPLNRRIVFVLVANREQRRNFG